jgi:hypothetical protein
LISVFIAQVSLLCVEGLTYDFLLSRKKRRAKIGVSTRYSNIKVTRETSKLLLDLL